MVHYRRNRVRGGTYFLTATLADRRSGLLVHHVELLRRAFALERRRHAFRIDAMVVMPDHWHAIWVLPPGDSDFSARVRRIKATFTRAVEAAGVPVTRTDRGEARVWQRRFWEHTIRDELDFQRHVDYIHFNPVKHGLVRSPAEWPYSSIHRYISRGLLPADWGGDGVMVEDVRGE